MPTIAETIKKVSDFAALSEGWHFGEGGPPSEEMRRRAVFLLRAAHVFFGIDRTNAFPGVRGQIQVTFYHAERMLELTLETDGTVTIAEDEGDREIVFEEGASDAEAFASLREFSQRIWATSESSTESITIQNVTISPVWRSTFPATNRYLSFTRVVPSPRVVEFVNILHGTIVSRPESRRSTGIFQRTPFQLTAASSRNEVPLAMIATTTSTVGPIKKQEESFSH